MQLHLIRRWVSALAAAVIGAILAALAGGPLQAVPLGAQSGQGAGRSCESLASLVLPHTTITMANPSPRRMACPLTAASR